jgi:predicted transposase YdaD
MFSLSELKQTRVYREAPEERRQEGRQEGQREEGLSLVLRLLNRRLGFVGPEVEAQVRGLPLHQLESLGEAVLDFGDVLDLQNWLRSHGQQSH